MQTMKRIQDLLNSQEYYEAQQAYKSTYYRQRARRQEGAIQQAYTILKEGAVQQFSSGQVTCGVELGLLLIEAYSEDKVPTSGGLEDALGSLCHIISSLPPAAAGAAGTTADGACTDGTDADGTKDRAPSSSSTGDAQGAAAVETQTGDPEGDGASSTSRSRAVVKEMSRLVSASVKWAQKQADLGAVRTIHTTYARWLWQTYGLQHLGLAVAHFSRGSEISLYNEVLQSCASQGYSEEAPLFITRGVLSVLAAAHRRVPGLPLQQLEQAEALFKLCQGWGPADAPLMHFLELLLQALRLRCAPLVRLLSERYKPSLAADAGLMAILNKVASIYVRIPGRQGRGLMGGLLGDLMKGMAGGEGGGGLNMLLMSDDDEDEDE